MRAASALAPSIRQGLSRFLDRYFTSISINRSFFYLQINLRYPPDYPPLLCTLKRENKTKRDKKEIIERANSLQDF